MGVNGESGKVVDMRTYGLLESASVKIQTLKTAIEVSACPRRSRASSVGFRKYLLAPLLPAFTIALFEIWPITHLVFYRSTVRKTSASSGRYR